MSGRDPRVVRLLHRSTNTDGQRHVDRYAALAADRIPLRYPDGGPTGFELDRSIRLKDGTCEGMARLDMHEVVDSPAGPLAFHRGGLGFEYPYEVKYGHVALDDLAVSPGRPVSSGGHRGAPVAVAGDDLTVSVQSIPPAMHYKRPQDTRRRNNAGAKFLHYGDPASDQGDRHDIHYTYLLWSLPNVRGGGMVRALLRDGARVEPCDLRPITMDSYDSDGAVNGWVEGVYVRVELEQAELYGWTIAAHALGDGEPVAHLL
jgi:hypothetical protein